MSTIAHVIGWSLLTAVFGVILSTLFFRHYDEGGMILFGIIGAFTGAIGGAAQEIVTALRHKAAN